MKTFWPLSPLAMNSCKLIGVRQSGKTALKYWKKNGLHLRKALLTLVTKRNWERKKLVGLEEMEIKCLANPELLSLLKVLLQ